MLYDELVEMRKNLSELEERCSADLKRAPQGSLRITSWKGYPKYYLCDPDAENSARYLTTKNMKQIQRLARKSYSEKMLAQTQASIKLIDKLLAQTSPNESELQPLIDVYAEMIEARKELVEPYLVSNQEYARMWAEEEFITKGLDNLTTFYMSARNERMRSKSEVIIADHLNAAGVPYRYEAQLVLNTGVAIHPDFTVLNARTRKVLFWEHQGMMDDARYAEHAIKRVELYELSGYFPGKDLITTSETRAQPLNINVVDALIEEYLT